MRKSPNFADKDLHVSNSNSGTPHVNRRSRIGKSFIYKVVQKSMWTLYKFALISVWSCQKIPKIQDLSVLIHAFSVLLLKRYCFTNFVFTSPPKLFISWNFETDWVTRTWNFMDFSSWGAILQARGVLFVFLFYCKCPGQRPRKSI